MIYTNVVGIKESHLSLQQKWDKDCKYLYPIPPVLARASHRCNITYGSSLREFEEQKVSSYIEEFTYKLKQVFSLRDINTSKKGVSSQIKSLRIQMCKRCISISLSPYCSPIEPVPCFVLRKRLGKMATFNKYLKRGQTVLITNKQGNNKKCNSE